MEPNKPRRIRDIAHLYISQLDRRPTEKPCRLLISAQDRDCLPGFHVANIAAALSSRGFTVHLLETSGLVPNSAFFLSLPPEVHLDGPEEADGSWYSALGGVSLTFGPAGASTAPAPVRAARTFEVVHVPPAGEAPRGASREPVGEGEFAVFELRLAPTGNGGAIECRVVDPRATVSTPQRGPESVETIERWQEALTDPIPPVIRDPGSLLSRAYFSLCTHVTQGGPRPARTEALDEGRRAYSRRRPHRRRPPGAAPRPR